jgi:fatty-acyl-CoA synthase
VFPDERFDALSSLRTIEQEKCTLFSGVPTIFTTLMEYPDFSSYDLRSLRGGLMGGSLCPAETVRKAMSLMNMRDILISYGLTEVSGALLITRRDDTLERRLTTVGIALPHVEIKIIDPATNNVVDRGKQGELCGRGFLVMKGYYKNTEATTTQIDSDSWLYTGDLATMDEDGYIKITGRLKDMIIRGGENIYPFEIENFLLTNPKISAVQVIGVPDFKLGEELYAWIKLKDNLSATGEEIKEFCKGNIAHYKIPKYIKFVSYFPMTASGKVIKAEMRRISVEELSSS